MYAFYRMLFSTTYNYLWSTCYVQVLLCCCVISTRNRHGYATHVMVLIQLIKTNFLQYCAAFHMLIQLTVTQMLYSC